MCRHHMSHMLNHFYREVRHFKFLYSWFQVVARLTQLWHNTTADATAPVLPAQIPPAHKYPISRSIPPALNLVYRPRSSRTFYTISLQPPSPSHPKQGGCALARVWSSSPLLAPFSPSLPFSSVCQKSSLVRVRVVFLSLLFLPENHALVNKSVGLTTCSTQLIFFETEIDK